MDVLEIVQKYLRDNGYDGLYLNLGDEPGDGCACGLGKFAPCGDMKHECEPAYELPDGDFSPIKPEEKP